uniref:Putative secreted protein n=1 Tax=Anopheles darlingi TaxID=43151 RepID=A0A2M4DFB1_ANODA
MTLFVGLAILRLSTTKVTLNDRLLDSFSATLLLRNQLTITYKSKENPAADIRNPLRRFRQHLQAKIL